MFIKKLSKSRTHALVKKYMVLFIATLLFSGCREMIQNDFPDFEQIPTLNSIITPDSLIELHLSVSNKLSKDSLAVFENASISLFVNATFYQKLTYTSRGIYLSDTIVKAMNNYRCELVWQNSIIVASCFAPQYTALQNVELNPYAWINMDGMTSPAVEFTISNNPLEKAYYEARIKVLEKATYDINQSFYYNDAFILNQFSNETIADSKITKKFEFELRNLSLDAEYAYILELRTISVDYYRYMQSLRLYEQGRFPTFDIGSIAPYNLYSNVENGYGIFAAYASTFSDTLFSN